MIADLKSFVREASSTQQEVGVQMLGSEDPERSRREMQSTGALDDWLHRGDHPIVKDMSWYAYAMWVYRVEKLTSEPQSSSLPRFIDISFTEDYTLYTSHVQRLASELRVPLFDGFIMPPSSRDSETAALFKSLLLRPLHVSPTGGNWHVERVANAFDELCAVEEQGEDGNRACTKAWLSYSRTMEKDAMEARRIFLSRLEFPSPMEPQGGGQGFSGGAQNLRPGTYTYT